MPTLSTSTLRPADSPHHGGKEFAFTREDFERIRRLIYDHAGSQLNPGKMEMVYSRLARRLRANGLTRFADYLRLLEGPRGAEWDELLLGAAQLRRMAVVPFVNSILDQGGAPRSRSDVFCVLAELVSNAIDYGVLELDPELRNRNPDGHEAFRVERERRLKSLADGWIRVRVSYAPGTAQPDGLPVLGLTVEDSGRGFSPGEFGLPAVEPASPRSGRGLALVRALCRDLRLENGGRRIVARMSL